MTFRRLTSFLLLAVLLLVAVGCDKCGGDNAKIPPTPKARMQQIAEHMPPKTEAVLFLSDLKKTREGLNVLKERAPQISMVEGFEKTFQLNFGIDLLDRESWKRAGIAPDATTSLGAYRSRLIFATYVENRQQFEKILTDKAKNAFQISSVTKSETVGGHKMKVLSDDPSRQIAWLYKGKLALVVMPATSIKNALQEGTASLVLADVAGTKKETSLGGGENFKAFQKELASNYTASIFINPIEYMNSEEFKNTLGSSPRAELGVAWTKKNVRYAGVGISITDSQADVKLHLGASPEMAKQALEAAKTAVKVDWTGYATNKVMIGVRLSVEWAKVWKLLIENMPEDDRRTFLRNLKMQGAALAIDIETDVLGKLTGNAGVFFYGMAGGLSDLMTGSNGGGLAEKAGLLVSLQFDNAASIKNLVDKVKGPMAMMIKHMPLAIDGQLVPGWEVIEFNTPQSPGRLFINGNNLIFATLAFSPKSVLDYATNKREETRLKDIKEMDLGQAFGGEAPYNGIYINTERLRDNLGAMLMAYPTASFLNEIEEASLQLGAEESGAYARLLIDLVPKKGTDTVIEGKGDKKAKKAEPKPATPKGDAPKK